jgi:AcrR family transcriptional regulator
MNSPGLRERKKQKTRWAIQEHALRLFAEQGYDATTVDQIAAAAEISPSTFFRYFPTKEDLVVMDEYDDMFIEGMRTLPPELPPLTALRRLVHTAFDEMTEVERERVLTRSRMTLAVPALRARAVENFLQTMGMMRELFAERTGQSPEDFRLRVIAGALVGAMIAAMESWVVGGGRENLAEVVDRTLAILESGLTEPGATTRGS